MMKGATVRQFTEWRTRQIPEPCVTRPHNTMRSAFCPGEIMCSQTPDTTKPMAKPDTPDVSPPKKAAARKSARFNPSIVVAPERKGTQRLDESHLTGRRHYPRPLPNGLVAVACPNATKVPSAVGGDGAWAHALEMRGDHRWPHAALFITCRLAVQGFAHYTPAFSSLAMRRTLR